MVPGALRALGPGVGDVNGRADTTESKWGDAKIRF